MTPRHDARAPLTAKDFHILYALTLRSMHGYALAQEVEERTEGAVRVEPANLYRRLHGFVEDGLIEEVEAPDEEVDARRRYYAVTDEGRLTVEAEVERMTRLVREARSHGLAPEAPGAG